MSPKIHPTFWSDEDVENLDAEGKLVLLWLITNPNTTLVGTCQPSMRRFQLDTALPTEGLERAYKALPKTLSVVNGVVFIRNFIRHQFGTGPKLVNNNIFKSIRTTYEAIKDPEIREAILSDYPEFREIEEGLTKPFITPLEGERERTRTGEGKRKGTRGGAGGESEAEEIFSLYPRRDGKAAALKAIAIALKAIPAEELREKVSAYAEAVSRWPASEHCYVPWCQKWMNHKRWMDDPRSWERNGKAHPSLPIPGGSNL